MASKKQYTPTGINMIDNLSPAERKDLRKRLQAHFDSLSPQERIEHMGLVHELHRQKLHQHHGHISKANALREFVNEDFPRILEETASDIQEEALRTGIVGYAHIAESIRKTRWGIDAFDIKINLVDDDRDVGVGSYEEKRKEE